MTYIRTKEIPPGSGNRYRYKQRSYRENGKVKTKTVAYLGPVGGSSGTPPPKKTNNNTTKKQKPGKGTWDPNKNTFYKTKNKDEVLSIAKYLGYSTSVLKSQDEVKVEIKNKRTDDTEFYMKFNGKWKELTTETLKNTRNVDSEKHEDVKKEEIEEAIDYK